MAERAEVRTPALERRFAAFVTERFPFALPAALEAFRHAGADEATAEAEIERLRPAVAAELRRRLQMPVPSEIDDTTPGVCASDRLRSAIDECVDACDAFLCR